MSRNAAATELQELIEQIRRMAERGERLAAGSGGLVHPRWFAAVRASMVMANGDLDEKGLLVLPAPESVR